MSKYTLDIHYPCGHVQRRQYAYQHMRGIKYGGQRPIKVVMYFMPEKEFLFKTLDHIMHPVKREGAFVMVGGEEVNATERYHELQMLELLEAI